MIRLFTMCILLASSLIPAIGGVSANDSSYIACSFTSEQLEFISSVKNVFIEHTEEKIIKKNFGHVMYQELAMNITQELIGNLESILVFCKDGKSELYDRNMSLTMSDLMWTIQEYKELLHDLRDFAKKTPVQDDLVSDGMLLLQKHILGDVGDKFPRNPFLKKSAEIRFDMELVTKDSGIAVDLDVESEGVGDMIGSIADGSIDLDVELDIEDEGKNLTFDGSTEMDLRIVDDNMFLKFQDTIFSINEKNLTSQELKELNKIEETMQLIQGKWLDLLGDNEFMGASNLFSMNSIDMVSMYSQIVAEITTYPWLMTYMVDDGVYYAGINPAVCLLAEYNESVTSCLEDLLGMNSLLGIDGKGFISFSMNNGEYHIQLTDKFMHDYISEDMEFMFNKKLLSRDYNGIQYVHIPLSEMGEITYDDEEIDGNITIPHSTVIQNGSTQEWVTYDINMGISGTIDENSVDVRALLSSKYLQGTLHVKNEGSLDNYIFLMDGNVRDTSDSGFALTYNLFIDANQREVKTISVEAPAEEDIVDLSVFY